MLTSWLFWWPLNVTTCLLWNLHHAENVSFLKQAFSKYTPIPFTVQAPPFQKSSSNTSSLHRRHRRHWSRCSRVTTGVTRWFLRGVGGKLVRNDTTGSATQVGLRPVKAGLWGHDDGASGVDEGVENGSIPLSKGDDWHCRNQAPSVVFVAKRMIWRWKAKRPTWNSIVRRHISLTSFRLCFSWQWNKEVTGKRHNPITCPFNS